MAAHDEEKPRRKSQSDGGSKKKIHEMRPMSRAQRSLSVIGCLLIVYVLVNLALVPLLESKGVHTPDAVAHAPGKEGLVRGANYLKDKFKRFREGRASDKSLLEDTLSEYKRLRKGKQVAFVPKEDLAPAVPIDEKPGFVVLGMHRSGTSMLSGLLVTSLGYNVGGPLIGAAEDNEKGFFERVDVVLQNDEFMNLQRVWWSANVRDYDWQQALRDKESGKAKFRQGTQGLRFLNDPSNSPWLQKDPRMCITLKTWLKLLDKEPAVVFTYRHPLEVAMSLKKRESSFTIEHGLRLWIFYNMRAVENSRDLCRVLSSNEKILKDPLHEIQRISDDLSNKCGVAAPPHRLQQADIDKFIDPNLQHNKKRRQQDDATQKVLAEYNNGACKVKDFASEFEENSPSFRSERDMYLKAMEVFCDFESGQAYKPDYLWPTLP